MAYWEFLLQKEGDRDWLPLETAHVEISEGRYRIVAHTSYSDTLVEICLSQRLVDDSPPQQRVLKREGRTTSEGLMVVLPFTHLAAGRWTIRCAAADVSSPWQYRVQLEVLTVDSGLEYWGEELEELAAQAQNAADGNHDVGSSPAGGEPTADAPPPFLAEDASIEDLPFRIQLAQQALFVQGGKALPLQGQVTTFSDVDGAPSEAMLWVQLREPDTGDVCYREARSLSLTPLPSPFSYFLSLPNLRDVRLLIGEMSLWTGTAPAQILAIQGFTVTLNIDALLESVVSQGESTATMVLEAPTVAAAESASVPREVPFRRLYLPATGLTLPPLVYLEGPSNKAAKAPSLPFSQSAADGTATDAVPSPAMPTAPRSQPGPSSVQLPSWGRSRPQKAPMETPVPVADLNSPAIPEEPAAVPSDDPPLPDFKGRFWSRLSSLAQDSRQAAADLKAEMAAAGLNPSSGQPEAADGASQDPLSPPEPLMYRHEVVVYESEANTEETALAAAPEPSSAPAQLPESSIQPPDEERDIPIPQILLPDGELTAGSPLLITVCLPEYPRRLAVKVWLIDVQTRSLVERPRWLMSWTPTENRKQVATLRLPVPLGSLDVQFEAIAIDLATQQESRKTSVARSIMPPNLPDTDITAPL